MSSREELTDAQVAELRARLEEAAEEADRGLSASSDDAKPVDLGLAIGRVSRIDALQQQQMAMARRNRVRLQRQQIRAALMRCDEGTYGECVACGDPIGYARLSARPEAPLCLECQSASGGG